MTGSWPATEKPVTAAGCVVCAMHALDSGSLFCWVPQSFVSTHVLVCTPSVHSDHSLHIQFSKQSCIAGVTDVVEFVEFVMPELLDLAGAVTTMLLPPPPLSE